MKFYRKYLLIFTTSIFLGLLLHIVLFYFNLGMPNAQEKYINDWFAIKDHYACSISDPKIMFVSGSNTLFGVDTERIEHELHIPTVNYGTHAGLSYYTLQRAKPLLHSGDIVILPLEYGFYTWHKDNLGGEFIPFILGYDPNYFDRLSVIQKFEFIKQTNTKDLLNFALMKYIPANQSVHKYDAKYLNANGDMTNYSAKLQNSSEVLLDKIIPNYVFSELPLTPDAQAVLSNFVDYCHKNNITIYAAWPNFLWRDKEFSGSDLDGINAIENFYNDHNVEILGNYTDCLYDAKLFYDTTDHLNADGKRIHTEYLIRLLRDKVHK